MFRSVSQKLRGFDEEWMIMVRAWTAKRRPATTTNLLLLLWAGAAQQETTSLDRTIVSVEEWSQHAARASALPIGHLEDLHNVAKAKARATLPFVGLGEKPS